MVSKKEKLYVLVGLLILLVLCEGLARLILSNDQIFYKIASSDDSSFRLKWIKKHQRVSDIYYKFDIYDPTKGWISRPGLRNENVFDGKFLNTNSKGLRGKTEYAYDKPPDKLRIVVLGDSYTFGDDVSDDETYPYYLQQMFPRFEVINMGVHGYGHDQMLILLKEEGLKYKPDIVILGFVYLDIYRNSISFRDYAKPAFFLEDGELVKKNACVPSPEESLKREWARPKLYDLYNIFQRRALYNRYSVRYGLFQKIRERATHDLTYCILDEMVSLIKSIDAKPIFVYLPHRIELREDRGSAAEETYFFDYCRTNESLECFSVLPYMAEQNEPDKLFMPSLHYSPSGNLSVAEAIRGALIERGVFAGNDQ